VARRDGSPGCSRRWAARLLASALVAGAGVALAPPALSSPPAPAASHDKSDQTDKKEAGKTPTVATVGPSGKIERKGEKAEEKPAARTEVKGEGKTEGKGDGKAEVKPEAKSDAKTEAKLKPEAKSDGKVEGKSNAKAEAKSDAKAEAKSDAKTETKKAEKAAGAGKGGNKTAAGDDEPAPPLTPPIKMSALRDEMSRPPRKEERSASPRSERERLEQLATEINKAREGLRQDTARLEALLAARDAAAQAAPPATAPAGGGDSGDPPKKTPTSLDNLAKAIRGMKPEQAAPIISRVDRKLAADVLLRMPGGDAGKVMGVCKPEVAAELAAEIASRTPRAELRR